MKRWYCCLGVLVRNVATMRRYWFNTLSALISLYVFFVLMFFGARSVGGPDVFGSGTEDAMIVGYFIWSIAVFAYSELSWTLYSEAQQGTLEQLYLSPFGFGFVNSASLAISMVFNLVTSGVLLLLAMLTTGRWLHIDVLSLLPVLACIMGSAGGIGLAMGGLALIHKRVQSFFQILQFVFIGFLVLPWSQFPWARYLPLAMGNHIAREIMSTGLRLWDFAPGSLAILFLTTVVYAGAGLAAFARAERVARDRGLLGHY